MKKAILLSAALIVCMAIVGQQQPTPNPNFKTAKATGFELQPKQIQTQANQKSVYTKQSIPEFPEKAADFVNIVNIGTSVNAWKSIQIGSFIWAEDNLKTVTNFHQFGGALQGSFKQYGYDISTDAGLNWINQILCFTENLNMQARQVHHGIYNPSGNLDPAEAYVSYFGNKAMEIPQYYYGRANIGNQSDTTDNWIYQVPVDSIYFYDPSGFVITQTGEIWVTNISLDWVWGTMEFQNKIIISHGVWNTDVEDFEFELSSIDFIPENDWYPIDTKVAFSPDGQVGWIAILSDDGSVPVSSYRSFYPILWKTTDAGQSWEGPIAVPIAGTDGIEEVKNFLSDEELEELYGFLPDRDSIPFTTAYDFDLHVDYWGNPHIAVGVGITGEEPYSIISTQSPTTGYTFMAAFDLTMDNNQTWKGFELGKLKTFRGHFDMVTEDNRIQIASSWDGIFMFITWNDTDLPGVEENIQPDIFCRGIDLMNGTLTGNNGQDLPYNVTEFSEGMWQAYFHNLSHYVLLDEGWFTIPLTYQEMNPQDLTQPVQYKYITDFTIQAIGVGVDESTSDQERDMLVLGPNPNPATLVSEIQIQLFNNCELDIEVCNLMGQKVFALANKYYPAGNHAITIDVSGFEPGVYIFVLNSKGNKISRKMIVE